jgi:stage V sporulation protein AC
MNTSKEQYSEMRKDASPNSPHLRHWVLSFLVGGAICALGQGFALAYKALGFEEDQVKLMVPCSLVLFSAILTGLGLFDKLGKHAGAGSAVPITGFANSIVSSAMEHKNEGLVLGVGANMFKLAGPVLVYGTAACTVYGIIYFIMQKG